MTSLLELTPERRIRIWPEFDSLPIEFELPRRRRLAIVVMAVICVIASALFFLYMWMTPWLLGGGIYSGIAISFGVTLAVLLVGWRAMRQYIFKDILRIDRSGIHVLFRGLIRDHEASWPLTACRGLRRRELRLVRSDGTKVNYTLIEILLGGGMSAPVIVERGIHGLSDELYAISDLLGLKIIRDEPAQTH